MSHLSYMEKLLDGADIKWKPLWQVTIWDKKFNAVERFKQPKVINYQYLLAADLFKLEQEGGDVFLLSTGERTGWTTEALAGSYLREGEVVTIPWGKSRPVRDVIKYYKGRFVTADNRIATSNNTEELLNKYLYYWLMSQSQIIDSYYRGSGIQHPSMADVLDILIPLPSIEIQAEIVRILDAFTAMTAELTAELNMRKKQYNYYRDQLLSFDLSADQAGEGEGVTPMSIGDIYDFQYGKGNTIPKEGGQYPVYGSNGVVGTHHEYNSEDSPVIGHIGAYAGIVNWGKGKHFVTYNGVICKHKSKEVNPQFAYYILLAQDFGSKAKNSSQPFVSYDTLKEPVVLIPSLAEQERIVSILDKFDALTSSITEGLPREIELRQKQYEYYRDLLLSFPASPAGGPKSDEAA
ncbi:restriction endonuclease subunit S [Shewanella sp. JNE10-2]|uniref:restriction endonuclease subunit S n=1 Tax=unclassified Shewanella TaxID=196818 RepID=UPI002004F131|nr:MULTISPECIES: restriction endonuclease subunit S [unclassified Shewanella]MCK7632270.1 restriction endonuclease subunit S [Shewanella sp. JNE9-1]MCK7643491.1 restriction endonuclease subunit S [Shewanella sp. JNE3-1]MCK7655574.1 restriction endonuclease subunit S [Shewanella sp. JNE4-1]UPO25612.1 restriction endonuclease subunit S [Shewanella sp. JNE10-2]UPO36597.1 restriction endonuclease subunit S [Shewanella sp. JNE7]